MASSLSVCGSLSRRVPNIFGSIGEWTISCVCSLHSMFSILDLFYAFSIFCTSFHFIISIHLCLFTASSSAHCGHRVASSMFVCDAVLWCTSHSLTHVLKRPRMTILLPTTSALTTKQTWPIAQFKLTVVLVLCYMLTLTHTSTSIIASIWLSFEL